MINNYVYLCALKTFANSICFVITMQIYKHLGYYTNITDIFNIR